MDAAHEIRHGDGLAGLLSLPRGAASLVLTDPPWGVTDAAWDHELDWHAWWSAIDHALASDGTVVAFVSFALGAKLIAVAPRRFAYDLIWEKSRAVGHLNANRAPMRAHETIVVFGGSRYAPQAAVGADAPEQTAMDLDLDARPPTRPARMRKTELYGSYRIQKWNPSGPRCARSVLHFESVARGVNVHPTQKPLELLMWLVRAFSRVGELVVDPTCGSGSTVHAAKIEGRSAIGWELDPENYARAARWWRDTFEPTPIEQLLDRKG